MRRIYLRVRVPQGCASGAREYTGAKTRGNPVSQYVCLPTYVPQFHHETPILHHVDARAGEPLGDGVVADAELHPDGRRARGQYVVHVRGNVATSPEDIHHVDVTRNRGERSEHGLAEDLRDGRIVDGHGHDLVAGVLRVLGHVVRRLTGLGDLDAEHRDAMRAL